MRNQADPARRSSEIYDGQGCAPRRPVPPGGERALCRSHRRRGADPRLRPRAACKIGSLRFAPRLLPSLLVGQRSTHSSPEHWQLIFTSCCRHGHPVRLNVHRCGGRQDLIRAFQIIDATILQCLHMSRRQRFGFRALWLKCASCLLTAPCGPEERHFLAPHVPRPAPLTTLVRSPREKETPRPGPAHENRKVPGPGLGPP